MRTERVCCVCSRTLGEKENYYMIDGVRIWCIDCGRSWLQTREPDYEARKAAVKARLAGKV